VCVTYKTGSRFDDWFYWHLIHSHNSGLQSVTALSLIYPFYSSPSHTHYGSVFTSLILATDLSQSHCDFKSHTKSSFHGLIHFLSFLSNHLPMPSPEFDPILENNWLKRLSLPLYNHSARTTQKSSLYNVEKACLLIRILAVGVLLLRAYVSAGKCLPSHCLVVGLYVTIL
jgi:hypothetical protein